MSLPADRVDQASAAKPRDLRQDLATAAEQATKKRRIEDREGKEPEVRRSCYFPLLCG